MTQGATEEWRPLALQVAQFQASTPARFHVTPRGQYLGPPLPPLLPAGQLTEAKVGHRQNMELGSQGLGFLFSHYCKQ